MFMGPFKTCLFDFYSRGKMIENKVLFMIYPSQKLHKHKKYKINNK